jgi:hypothetical protein
MSVSMLLRASSHMPSTLQVAASDLSAHSAQVLTTSMSLAKIRRGFIGVESGEMTTRGSAHAAVFSLSPAPVLTTSMTLAKVGRAFIGVGSGETTTRGQASAASGGAKRT